MEKTATLNLRVSPAVKANAEAVLEVLGIPMSTAVDAYLRQIALTGGIPFAISLPPMPSSINADAMSAGELHAAIKEGYDDMIEGRVRSASEVFATGRS